MQAGHFAFPINCSKSSVYCSIYCNQQSANSTTQDGPGDESLGHLV